MRIDEAIERSGVYVSCISAWEVAMLVSRDRLKLTMAVEEWIGRCEALPQVKFVPVSNAIAVRSVQLPGSFHADLADRIIVATALTLGATVITKDARIRRYPHVRSTW